MDEEAYVERVETHTVGRFDVTPLFADASAFEALRADLLAGIEAEPTVVGNEPLGFVPGSAVAVDLGVGFVPVREEGKLPYPEDDLHRREVTDYSGSAKTLELHPGPLDQRDRALVVDDWVQTGTQMRATVQLVEATGASVATIATGRAGDGIASLAEDYAVHTRRETPAHRRALADPRAAHDARPEDPDQTYCKQQHLL